MLNKKTKFSTPHNKSLTDNPFKSERLLEITAWAKKHEEAFVREHSSSLHPQIELMDAKEERNHQAPHQWSVQNAASVMVWVCFRAYGTGNLHIWKGSINAERHFYRF